MKNKILLIALIISGITTSLIFSACKHGNDAHTPPLLVFKTDSGYVSHDTTLTIGDTITVGLTATKTEDELKTFNVSVAFDGAATSTTVSNTALSVAQYDSYSKDVVIGTRTVTGTEKYSFTVTDMDGNITTKTLTITVN